VKRKEIPLVVGGKEGCAKVEVCRGGRGDLCCPILKNGPFTKQKETSDLYTEGHTAPLQPAGKTAFPLEEKNDMYVSVCTTYGKGKREFYCHCPGKIRQFADKSRSFCLKRMGRRDITWVKEGEGKSLTAR